MIERIKMLLQGTPEDILIGLHLLKGIPLDVVKTRIPVRAEAGLVASIEGCRLVFYDTHLGETYFEYVGYTVFIANHLGICFSSFYNKYNIHGWEKYEL